MIKESASLPCTLLIIILTQSKYQTLSFLNKNEILNIIE